MSAAAIRLRAAQTDPAGFEALGSLYAAALGSTELAIQVDCSSMGWIDANLASALQAIRHRLRVERGKLLHLMNVPDMPRQALAAIGYLPSLRSRPRSTIIPLQQFALGEGKEFAAYSKEHFANKGLPTMSDAVKERFFEGIDELFQNCDIHSESALGVFASGQLFPRKDRLDFSITDVGLGFPHVVGKKLGQAIPPPYAIDWAMTGSNTTRMGDVPGGLGLKILREFIRKNGGRLVVASYGGYWSEQKGQLTQRTLAFPFPGTAVTIEVNTADDSKYMMSNEIDPARVF